MIRLIIDVSVYLIPLLFVLFMLVSVRNSLGKTTSYGVQYMLLVLVHAMLTLVITLERSDYFYVVLFLAMQLAFVVFRNLYRILYPQLDRALMNQMLMFLCIGIMMISRISQTKAIRQFVIMVIAMVISLFIPLFIGHMKGLRKLTWLYGIIGFAGIFVVLCLGAATNGSKISFTIKGITFQPSELVKILYVFFLAGLLASGKRKNKFLATLCAGAYVLVLVFSKDLGSGLIFFACYVFMLYASSGKVWTLLAGLGTAVMGCLGGYKLFYHVKVRVMAWKNPFADITGKGYQIAQSLFAIGTGGLFGLGFGRGIPGMIPYVEADFIFSAITEELGVLVGIGIIGLCILCFARMLKSASKVTDSFYKMVATGLGVIYIFQVFLTIGGGIKFIPLTGVTLPLVSYGGTSVFVSVILFQIVQGIAISADREQMEEESRPTMPYSSDYQFYELPQAAICREEYEEEISFDTTTGEMTDFRAKKKKNSIRFVTVCFTALFGFMTVYLGYFMVFNRSDVIDNPYNTMRQTVLLRDNIRGSIYAKDGTVLAYTEMLEDGTQRRIYPEANQYAHIIGYTTNGKMGLESDWNFQLLTSHQSFLAKIQDDFEGNMHYGDDAVTSIDPKLQQIAYDALGNRRGAVIVSDPKTGQIMAMVSKPDFDPNRISVIWNDLIGDDTNSVLLNRATKGLYPPGSTFKIFTALEYYREYGEAAWNYSFDCDSFFKAPDGTTIYCFHHTSHGLVDFKDSFAYSCNASFSNIAMSLDTKLFENTLSKLLFDKKLPGAFSSSNSRVTLGNKEVDDTMIQTAIGQGDTLVTPMHLNMITCAIANDGVLMRPYAVTRLVNHNGSTVRTFSPKEYGRLLNSDEAAVLQEMMAAVCKYGTGKAFQNTGYQAAGKTGSAEYTDALTGENGSHAWFTGYAPCDNPQIVVTVLVEGGGTGSSAAVPIAEKVMTAFLK